MQRRQLIKGLAAGAIVSTLLPAFAAEPVTLKVGASPLVTGDILEFVKPALAKKGINLKIIEFTDYIQPKLMQIFSNTSLSWISSARTEVLS